MMTLQEHLEAARDYSLKGCTAIEVTGITFSNLSEMLQYMDKQKNEIESLKAQIEKMRNFENCDYQLHITDCPIFKSGGHISCNKCPHWILQEIKENE